MRETIEFRVPEALAESLLPAGVGASSGIARTLKLRSDDSLFQDVKRIDQRLRGEGRAFYTAWVAHRRYSGLELDRASLFHVWPKRTFEPAGEECGTIYDDATVCPECKSGATQTSLLFLDGRRIPKSVDIARTIAGEIVISARFVELFQRHGLTGAEFGRVHLSNGDGVPSADYFQLEVVGARCELDPATRAGEDPFDEDGYGRCSRGHVVGLNLLSEVTVKDATVPDADVMMTRQMVGVRRGLLRPQPILLLSPRAWRTIEHMNLKGLRSEIAHRS